jgi:hypothetical protein
VSLDSLNQFRRAVLEDASLRESLRGTQDLETFLALVLRAGRERGYEFTRAEVEELLRQGRRAWLERWVV